MKAQLIRPMPKREKITKRGKTVYKKGMHPIGAIIEGPRVYFLVRQGVAVPADKACEKAAHMTPEQMKAAQEAFSKLAKGIAPEDYEAYNRGLMVGYKTNGKKHDSWKPGPNWTTDCEAEYYAQLDNEEEDDDE